MTQIAEIVTRARATFVSDAAGVLTLAAFTYGLFYLPHLI
jgi:hypothetical protein